MKTMMFNVRDVIKIYIKSEPRFSFLDMVQIAYVKQRYVNES